MSAIKQLRDWAKSADGRTVEIRPDKTISASDVKWDVKVTSDGPMRFQISSGWQDSVETAARVVVAEVLKFGGELPEA